MDKWIDVVTDPLGLVGFALFLVFTFLARHNTRTNDPVRLIFASLAVVAVIGGLALSWLDHRKEGSGAATQPAPPDHSVPAHGQAEVSDKRVTHYYSVLVTPFENNTIGERANSLRDILEDVVFCLGGRPVERKTLDHILQELQFETSSGLVDPSKAAAVGRMVGARYVFVGSIGKIDDEKKTFSGYNINTLTRVVTVAVRVRLIDVETTAIVYSRELTGSRSSLESKYGRSGGADMIVGSLEDALKVLYDDQMLKHIITAQIGPN